MRVDNALPVSGPNFDIALVGANVVVTTQLGFTVTWNRQHIVTVNIEDSLLGNVCGLCGDADTDKNNDIQIDGASVRYLQKTDYIILCSFNY